MKLKDWINRLLYDTISDSIIAFCFNIYETDSDTDFDVQLVGCTKYDPDNDDWACETDYSSEEDLYSFQADDWEDAMEKFGKELNDYLQSPECHDQLKKRHIAYGFVDGDLEYIC